MRKALLTIALLLGIAGAMPTDAQRVVPTAVSEGTAAASLEELATLAEEGKPVMLWNNGRSRYAQNTLNSSNNYLLRSTTSSSRGAK